VEVDGDRRVNVKEVWDVHDCGFVINPALLHGQVHGALCIGMGEAVWEEVSSTRTEK
jgi:4-hydroxybenzoyl-CoA reductase subunit alpha